MAASGGQQQRMVVIITDLVGGTQYFARLRKDQVQPIKDRLAAMFAEAVQSYAPGAVIAHPQGDSYAAAVSENQVEGALRGAAEFLSRMEAASGDPVRGEFEAEKVQREIDNGQVPRYPATDVKRKPPRFEAGDAFRVRACLHYGFVSMTTDANQRKHLSDAGFEEAKKLLDLDQGGGRVMMSERLVQRATALRLNLEKEREEFDDGHLYVFKAVLRAGSGAGAEGSGGGVGGAAEAVHAAIVYCLFSVDPLQAQSVRTKDRQELEQRVRRRVRGLSRQAMVKQLQGDGYIIAFDFLSDAIRFMQDLRTDEYERVRRKRSPFLIRLGGHFGDVSYARDESGQRIDVAGGAADLGSRVVKKADDWEIAVVGEFKEEAEKERQWKARRLSQLRWREKKGEKIDDFPSRVDVAYVIGEDLGTPWGKIGVGAVGLAAAVGGIVYWVTLPPATSAEVMNALYRGGKPLAGSGQETLTNATETAFDGRYVTVRRVPGDSFEKADVECLELAKRVNATYTSWRDGGAAWVYASESPEFTAYVQRLSAEPTSFDELTELNGWLDGLSAYARLGDVYRTIVADVEWDRRLRELSDMLGADDAGLAVVRAKVAEVEGITRIALNKERIAAEAEKVAAALADSGELFRRARVAVVSRALDKAGGALASQEPTAKGLVDWAVGVGKAAAAAATGSDGATEDSVRDAAEAVFTALESWNEGDWKAVAWDLVRVDVLLGDGTEELKADAPAETVAKAFEALKGYLPATDGRASRVAELEADQAKLVEAVEKLEAAQRTPELDALRRASEEAIARVKSVAGVRLAKQEFDEKAVRARDALDAFNAGLPGIAINPGTDPNREARARAVAAKEQSLQAPEFRDSLEPGVRSKLSSYRLAVVSAVESVTESVEASGEALDAAARQAQAAGGVVEAVSKMFEAAPGWVSELTGAKLGDLAVSIVDSRNDALGKALAGLVENPDAAKAVEAAKRVSESAAGLAAKALAAEKRLQELRAALENGVQPDEPAPGGSGASLGEAIAGLDAGAMLPEVAGASAAYRGTIEALQKGAKEVADVRTATSLTEIEAALKDSSAGVAIAAWRRSGELGEAPTWEWLEVSREIANKLQSASRKSEAARKLADAVRGADGALAERWARYFNGAGAGIDVENAMNVNTRKDCGVVTGSIARLNETAKFNWTLWEAKQRAAEATDEAARSLQAFQAAAADNPGIAAALGMLPTGAGQVIQGINVSTSGPASSEQFVFVEEGRSASGAKTVTYAVKGMEKDPQARVTFAQVSGSAEEERYLATTEVSVGFLKRALTQIGGTTTLLADTETIKGTTYGSARTGPWVWQLNAKNDELEPSGKVASHRDGWVGTRHASLTKASYLPDGMQPSEPTEQHPMQYISAITAARVAAEMGCRLPTPEEFRRAVEMDGASASGANLLDESARQVREAPKRKAAAAGKAAMDLCGNAFASKDLDMSVTSGTNDGQAWLRFVNESPTGTFTGLIGNVAEYVCSAPEEIEGTEAAKTIGEKLATGNLFVAGGSAWGDPALATAEVKAIPSASVGRAIPKSGKGLGFSDVGFRLAFTARAVTSGDDPTIAMQRAIQAMPYAAPAKP